MDDFFKFKEWLENDGYMSDHEIANIYFHNQNVKISEIAERSKRSIGEIYRIISRFGSPNRTKTNQHHIDYYHEAGFKVKKIAEFTGYSERNVRHRIQKVRNGS